jgi:hypothetical protein
MQLFHALALVAALCTGSGAASDLRGAVRAGVDSNKNNQCTCNLAGPPGSGQTWPASTCDCSQACSNTCCYFSQPGQFWTLVSSCLCKEWTGDVFLGYTPEAEPIPTKCGGAISASSIGSAVGNNYYHSGWGSGAWTENVKASWYTTSQPYNPACMCGDSPCKGSGDSGFLYGCEGAYAWTGYNDES